MPSPAAPAPWRLPVLPPLLALAELAVLVGLILAVDRFVPDVDVFALQPNPLWLPIVLLAMQYGTVSGLLAAGVAIAILAVQGFPAQDVGENLFAYLLRVWSQPVLWIAAALLLGQLRMRQLTAKHDLRRQVEDLTAQRDVVAAHAGRLRQRCDRLERVMAGARGGAAPDLADLLAAVPAEGRTPGRAFAAAVAAVVDPDVAASVHVATGEGFTLVGCAGWPDAASWPGRIDGSAPLARAIGEGRRLCVLRAADAPLLEGHGLAAVPVRGTDGTTLGMLKIERVRAEAVTDTLGDRLAVLAALLAEGFAHAAQPAAGGPARDRALPRAFTHRFARTSSAGSAEAQAEGPAVVAIASAVVSARAAGT